MIIEEEIRRYLIHKKTKTGWSASSMRTAHGVFRYFYQKVLDRDWRTLDLIKGENERRLPAILSVAEVRRVFENVFYPVPHLHAIITDGLFRDMKSEACSSEHFI